MATPPHQDKKKKSSAADGKTIAPPKPGSKPNALQQKMKPSEALAAIVGKDELARGEMVSKVWAYVKENKLQNPKDGREILADAALKKIFEKDKVTMFEMNKLLSKHLSSSK